MARDIRSTHQKPAGENLYEHAEASTHEIADSVFKTVILHSEAKLHLLEAAVPPTYEADWPLSEAAPPVYQENPLIREAEILVQETEVCVVKVALLYREAHLAGRSGAIKLVMKSQKTSRSNLKV